MEMKSRNDHYESLVIPKERHKANARERVRTCRQVFLLTKPLKSRISVNRAFTTLRNLIPTDPADRKLSKIETLRLACSYISHLGSILVTGSCEITTAETVAKDFAKKSAICTFCVTSAKLKSG